jgi:MFS superfamily sulfate permease-like transporter
MTVPSEAANEGVPHGDWIGFKKYLRYDFVSGFLVFLIALPLCLGISLASGYPAVAGVFTAIIGSIVASLLSNSELTIKGPAAGLIVIAIGTVTEFGFTGGADPAADFQAYRMALAVGVVAGVIQVGFGMLRFGVLGNFFPTSVVHGMLAAIGVIIMLKQIPVAMGESAKGEPIEIVRDMPHTLANANPEILLIGAISLIILFGKPLINVRWVKLIPSPLIVLLVAVPLGMYFDLPHTHTFSFLGHDYELSEKYLVSVPENLFNAVTYPDFSALARPAAWKWVLMYALIGSLESMLSCKAIDMVDPWKRKTNLNRDLMAVGVANTAAAMIGALPMISEIVRSKANIDNGARTRFADMWHGVFLLGFVALLPFAIHMIPLAALAAMLVYTGFRLASPKEFINVVHIGREQLIVFIATILGVLATDLLVGILIGIGVKVLIHLINGVPLRSLFKAYLEVEDVDEKTSLIRASQSAVFSNWIPFKRQIEDLGRIQRRNVVVDLSGTKLVDHSVMERLEELREEFHHDGLSLSIVGLEDHAQFSRHSLATRRRTMSRLRRVTIVTEPELEEMLAKRFIELGASGYTAIPCRGAGRRGSEDPSGSHGKEQVRIEVVVPESVMERILSYLHQDILPKQRATVTVETVETLRPDRF